MKVSCCALQCSSYILQTSLQVCLPPSIFLCSCSLLFLRPHRTIFNPHASILVPQVMKKIPQKASLHIDVPAAAPQTLQTKPRSANPSIGKIGNREILKSQNLEIEKYKITKSENLRIIKFELPENTISLNLKIPKS